MAPFTNLIDRADDSRKRIQEIHPTELKTFSGSTPIFLDVRELEEFQSGHLPEALHLPWSQLDERALSLIPDQDSFIVTYCTVGHRSAIAADILQGLGYRNVVSLKGGLNAFRASAELSKVA